jgi:hypothetical protein
MTTTTTTTTEAVVKLRDNERACRDCGAIVSKRRDAHAPDVAMRVYWRQMRSPVGDFWSSPLDAEYEATRCVACRTRFAIAEGLVRDHEFVRRRTGSRKYVVRMVDAALMTIDALGLPLADAAKIAATDRGLFRLIQTLPAAGSRATWAARFSPTLMLGVDPMSGASARWSHVTPDEQQNLRDAFTSLLGLLHDPMQKFPAPPDGAAGCLLCGVGEFESLRSVAHAGGVWTGPFRARTRQLGGAGSADAVHGYLCRPCAASVEKAGGALGAQSLEQALIDALGVSVDPALEARLVGLQAWCALPLGTPPNKTAWGHVDLEQAADLLRSV